MSRLKELNKLYDLFDYVLEVGPIDHWEITLSKDQIVKNFKEHWGLSSESHPEIKDKMDLIERYVMDYVTHHEEEPQIIRYLGFPSLQNHNMEIIALAKIRNNGTTYIFSNNKLYLEMVTGFEDRNCETKSFGEAINYTPSRTDMEVQALEMIETAVGIIRQSKTN